MEFGIGSIGRGGRKLRGQTRRAALTLCVSAFVALAAASTVFTIAAEAAAQSSSSGGPALKRIKVVTVASSDVTAATKAYADGLGFSVRDEGRVSQALAAVWGEPKMTGRPYVVLSNDVDQDVFIRLVEIDPVPGYKPMTTYGWNSFEFVIDDYRAAQSALEKSTFKVIGGPNPLKSNPNIVTLQARGAGDEILYFADETTGEAGARFPTPGTLFGRPFIVILAGADIVAVRDWYADKFGTEKSSIRESGGAVVPQALGLPPGSSLPISIFNLRESGNRIQLDGYTKGSPSERPRAPGQLPPGNAMVSFSVDSLKVLDIDFVSPPVALPDIPYAGAKVAAARGPAGELIEFIEESAP
ncbi:MAG: VOC family protein [Rhodobacteraceae bacterium]|nr:VOC family protein [Paracoccaceae bacterium]